MPERILGDKMLPALCSAAGPAGCPPISLADPVHGVLMWLSSATSTAWKLPQPPHRTHLLLSGPGL